jgi:AcrR family transcriptional regulator
MEEKPLPSGAAPPATAERAPDPARRSGRAREAILEAAATLLEEVGWGGLTMEMIAARAGVGKQTIYRWWPSKAAVVLEGIAELTSRRIPEPDTGDLRRDLTRLLADFAKVMADPRIRRAWTGLVAEMQVNEAFARAFRAGFTAHRRAVFRRVLERALARGELPRGAPVELLLDLILGPVWYRLLNAHAPFDATFGRALVRRLFPPVPG